MNKNERELVRVHLHLDAEHVERIRELYGRQLGFSSAIRLILAKFLKECDAKIREQGQSVKGLDNGTINEIG